MSVTWTTYQNLRNDNIDAWQDVHAFLDFCFYYFDSLKCKQELIGI